MTKPIPSYDPHYYAVLSSAVYEKDKITSQNYIQNSYPDAQVLEEHTILFIYKFMLVKRGDELTAVFRGVKHWLEYGPAAMAQIHEPYFLVKSMEENLGFWKTKHGNIKVVTGHSKAVIFVNAVMKTDDVIRITFNGQHVQDGKKTINLRTENDILYRCKISDKSRSISIGLGDHPIIDCIRNLVGKKWSDISNVFITPQQDIPHVPSNSLSGCESIRQQLATEPVRVCQLLQGNENTTRDCRVQVLSDATSRAVYPVSPFAPSLASLAPTSIVEYVNRLFLGPDTFRNCYLLWQATQSASTGITTVTTSVEIPPAELAQLEELPPIEWEPSLPPYVPPSKSSESYEPENPTFLERSRIIGIRAGEVHGRGRGLIIALGGGADVSLTTDGDKYYTGVSAPLTLDFLSSVGSGLLYALPIAATIYGIHQLGEFYNKRFFERLEKEGKGTKKDLNRINNSVQQFNSFVDQFSRGEIHQEAFLAKLNELYEQIDRSSKEMSRRGRYLDKHRDGKTTEGRRAFLTHFAAKTILRQIDRDLETIAASVIAQREVQDKYTPELKERPLQVLCDDLQALFNKRVLSINEKFQQEALIKEISGRLGHESAGSLNVLDALTHQPVAISLQPVGVAKPMHLSSKHFAKGSTPSKERRAERIKEWANKLDAAYQHFRKIALTGDVVEMEKAAEAVVDQLNRAKGQKDVNLHKYKIVVANPESDDYFRKAKEYYKSYTDAIESNTRSTLAKAKAAKAGVVTADLPALFTQEELNSLKAEAAINAFNSALRSFQTGEEVNKDTAFVQMYEAAQVLDTLQHKAESEEDNQLVQSTLTIGREHGTYSNYQRTQDRTKSIRADIGTIESSVAKLKDPSVKKEEKSKHYKLAYESAIRLKEMGLTEEDTAELTDNPENSRLLLAKIDSVYESYPNFVREGHYEDTCLPVFSAPLVRFGLHVLNDLQQYEGYQQLKPIGWGLSTTHAIAPGLLPSAVNLGLAGLRLENRAVLGSLFKKMLSTVTTNVFTTSAYFLYSPLQTLENEKSFSKKISMVSNTSIALQFGAAIVTTVTTKYFSARDIQTFNSVVSFVPSAVGTASSALHYLNVLDKTKKYLKAGTLSLKLHKVGQSWISLGLAGCDVLEICATDPAELGIITGFMKNFLPSCHGQLPETKRYYEGKDIVALAVATGGLCLAAGPVTIGVAAAQAGIVVWNRYMGTYSNNAISATLANCRYYLRQKFSEENHQALARSLKSLEDQIEGTHCIQSSDSPIKKQAKLFHFECVLDQLEKIEEWEEIIKQTSFEAEGENYKFIELNIDVFDAINLLLKHFSAATQSPAYILIKVDELDAISKYLTRRISEVTAQDQGKDQDYTSTIESLSRIRSKLHSNFGVFYLNNKFFFNPRLALKMFDGIAPEHRELVDWWVLGSIVWQLRTSEDPTSFKLTALELFCFQTLLELLQEKKGIPTAFDQELKRRAIKALKKLKGTLPDNPKGVNVTTATTNFTEVIQSILPPKQSRARLLETNRKSLD